MSFSWKRVALALADGQMTGPSGETIAGVPLRVDTRDYATPDSPSTPFQNSTSVTGYGGVNSVRDIRV